MSVRILHGNCLDILPTLAEASVDSVVTDPPYHLTSIVKRFGAENAAPAKPGVYGRSAAGFMGKQWDGGDIAFRPETWEAVWRVMKPGAYLVAFASTRGYHRMTCAIEDAGFVIHPMLGWIFGAGFPKATRFKDMPELDSWRYGLQALKPAIEPICLAQKPMIGTGPENWRAHGVGGINIDACRVEGVKPVMERTATIVAATSMSGTSTGARSTGEMTTEGRWPANVVHDGSDEVLEAFAAYGERTSGSRKAGTYGTGGSEIVYGERGTGEMPPLSGSAGTAARFFYSAKATAEDRMGSKHPTIKPLALMDWLVKLITPPGGTVLDPFAGSGTTLLAADRLQMNAIGIDMEVDHVADIKRRFTLDAPLFAEVNV